MCTKTRGRALGERGAATTPVSPCPGGRSSQMNKTSAPRRAPVPPVLSRVTRLGALAALTLLSATAPASAEVWKCRAEDGGVRFSDKPCPGSGDPLDARRLQPNVVDAVRLPTATSGGAREAEGDAAPRAPVNDCPGDQELRDMETRANARSLGEAEKTFMQDEIRRVLQCRKGQGRYTWEDWKISREARAAQSSSNAESARRRAEAMHSAADPVEGDRIAQQRRDAEREQALAAARQRRLQQQPRPITPPQPPLPPCPAGAKSSGAAGAQCS